MIESACHRRAQRVVQLLWWIKEARFLNFSGPTFSFQAVGTSIRLQSYWLGFVLRRIHLPRNAQTLKRYIHLTAITLRSSFVVVDRPSAGQSESEKAADPPYETAAAGGVT